MAANTLNAVIPTLYEGLHQVSRTLVGFIPAVNRNSGIERAALNQSVRIPVAAVGAAQDATPAATSPDTAGVPISGIDLTISKSRVVPFNWNGEEQIAVGSSGQYNKILSDQLVLAMGTLVDEVEQDCAIWAKQGASRAYGTAGTTPFGTAADLTDFAGVHQILDDNGAPQTDLQIVVNSSAMFNLRGKQTILNKVNEAGSSDMLRDGFTDRIQGMALRYSGGIRQHVKGTGSGYLVNNGAGIAVGGTSVAVDTGTGTILAGDIITAAADPVNKYVAGAALAGGILTLNRNGARVLLPDNNALTVGNNYTGNFAFDRNAIALATRMPAAPEGGDSADDVLELIDPISGLAFEVRVYRQYRQVRFEVGLAWGGGAVNTNHIATLVG